MADLPLAPADGLILAGDVGETLDHLRLVFDAVLPRFGTVFWTPGNHELWTTSADGLRGEAKYAALVRVCREHGVVTPEDDYRTWSVDGETVAIAPTFVLYDYSFRPDDVPAAEAVAWAREAGLVCADEQVLHPDPHPSRADWCAARLAATEPRLAAAASRHRLVIVNHFPLRRDQLRLRRIPRFSIWCGTTRTEDWHTRFRARVVVSGHQHVRWTEWRDGTRFEEVALGYPRDWRAEKGIAHYLREILPGPSEPHAEPRYHG